MYMLVMTLQYYHTDSLVRPPPNNSVYRGTSLIRNNPPPYDHHRTLGIGLL